MAKKTVSSINIRIGASSGQLKRDMAVNKASVSGFASSAVNRLGGVVSGLLAMAAATAAATLSIRGLVTAFGEIDKTAKVAAKLGLATEELVALRHASELSGVGADTLDMALQRMTRRIAEAAAGTGEAVKALEELGLSAKELRDAGPAEAFKRIAEAMAGVAGPADKLRLAFKLFDSEGAALVNTLAMGRSGLEAVEREVKELGVAFSAVDAAKVEAANDAILRMQTAFKGVTTELAIAFAPAVEATAKAIQDLLVWMRSINLETVRTTAKVAAFAVSFAAVINIIPRMVAGIRSVIVAIKAMTTASTIAQALSGPTGWATLAAGIAIAAGAAVAVDKAFDSLSGSMAAATDKSKAAVADVRADLDALADTAAAVGGGAATRRGPISVGAAVVGTTAGIATLRTANDQLRASKEAALAETRTRLLKDIKTDIADIRRSSASGPTVTTHRIL